MAHVFIPAPLRDLTGGVREVDIEATTVGEVLDELERRFPGVSARLCVGGELSPAIQVAVDNKVSSRGKRTEVGADSEVHFLPAIGGG